MAFWNRKTKQPLNESGATSKQLDITDLLSLPYYQFASSLTSLRGNTETVSSTIKDAMLQDPIISQIINMWISDALSTDILTGDVFDVVINKNNDSVTDDAIKNINEQIKVLLNNSNLLDLLTQILYLVIINGIVNVRMGFVDVYEDTKIKLFESNKKLLESNNDVFTSKKLIEAPNYDDYEDNLMRSKPLNKSKIKRVLGRYYFEILPSKLVPLRHKGITILYLDIENSLKVLNPRNITTFVNTRGGVKTLSLKKDPTDIISEIYEIPVGKSFIENSVTPWSMLNTTEDCTLLALMTRSSIYRLFQLDVGALDTVQTEQLVQEFKKRITTRETIDIRSQHYSSAQTQIPLGDSIIIPTRNGVGSISVQNVGGDLDIKTQVPLDFFREELLASLGIPKALVYGDSNGALINTSAVRQDIRYLRTIQQFTSILSAGLESIFKDYLSMIGVNLTNISLKVKFAHLNSEEALQRIEFEQTRQEALDRSITSLNNLGIEFSEGKYTKTRDELIKRYMDQDLLEIIHQDESSQGLTTPLDDNPPNSDDQEGLEPLPSGSPLSSDEPSIDLGTSDEIPEPTEEDITLPEVEPTDNIEVNENPPYSLG